jgi:transcriptional regulator with XRE-family HTH domain
MTRIRGHELRYQAAIRGWDQRSLAEAAGVSQATISRAMAGGLVRRSTLLRLARALYERAPMPELQALVHTDEPA